MLVSHFLCSHRYLGFDHTATLFHIRDSPVDPVDRPIFLTNAFSFAIWIHNVSLPEEAKTMFNVSLHRLSSCSMCVCVSQYDTVSSSLYFRCRT